MRTQATVGYLFTDEISQFVSALDNLKVLGKRGAEYEIVTGMGGHPLIIMKTSKELVDLEDLLKFWFYERRAAVGAEE